MKITTMLAALVVVAPTAVHAQQRAPAAGGAQGHNMPGMDMQTMMNQCAQMRRQMAQGRMSNAPDMNRMMAQCDQMDRQMGGGASSNAPMPNAARSR